MLKKLVSLLVSINLTSLLLLKREVYLANYTDCALNLLPIFNLCLVQNMQYLHLLLLHLIILAIIFFQSRFSPVLYLLTLAKLKYYKIKYVKIKPYPQIEMKKLPYPAEVIEAIESILLELKFEVRCLKLCYNERLITYYLKFSNLNLLMNLSGYFLKSNLIHSVRIAQAHKNIIKIEAIYGEDKISREEVISRFEHNSQKIFMSLGKDAENKVFVEKLSDIAVFGRPGSGKTNFLHQIIISLLRNKRVDKLKLFLVNFNNEFIQHMGHEKVVLYNNKSDLDQMIVKLQKIINKRVKNNVNNIFANDIVVMVDNFELLGEELNEVIIQSRKHQVGIFFIISTSYIYNNFLKQNFANKVIFKLRDNLEKQYLAQKNLPNESLMNYDDCFYVNQKGVFRIQVPIFFSHTY